MTSTIESSARYFDLFVIPNFRLYRKAEAIVTEAFNAANADLLIPANEWALAAGMNAAVPAYHMADALYDECPALMGDDVTQLPKRERLQTFRSRIESRYCRMMRMEDFPVQDLNLLGAVVDAYKHAVLDNKHRPVTSNRATVVTATGFGELGLGEGKFGGVDQVIVRLQNGRSRALSSILQNVVDMWRALLNRPQEDVGR